MIVYRVVSQKMLQKYIDAGGIIQAPIRAWKDIKCAEKFSLQTGRSIILRLKFPKNAEQLEGHKGNAVVIRDRPYVLNF